MCGHGGEGSAGLDMGRVKWDKDGADVGLANEVEGCRAMWTSWNPEVLQDLVERSGMCEDVDVGEPDGIERVGWEGRLK